ncbi:hypothetical protein L6278_02155 [Candidatus Parcubacteria bacterium]|nr:hypothetical protein [Patescibacteria group bacterium]MCG2686921.1 hypothetical protein [Candidatus Parcubacteria bacterium]
MRLSHLQKFILLQCLESRTGKISRTRLNQFYNKSKKLPKKELQTKIITKSMERLIEKELLVGFGQRTKYKWFIKEIKLTRQGKKEAKKLFGEQLKIKFKIKK